MISQNEDSHFLTDSQFLKQSDVLMASNSLIQYNTSMVFDSVTVQWTCQMNTQNLSDVSNQVLLALKPKITNITIVAAQWWVGAGHYEEEEQERRGGGREKRWKMTM